MGILERLALPARHRDQSLSINDWADYFTFGGNTYPVVQTTMGTVDREQVGFTSVAGFKGSGPIFSLVLARLQVFSQVRFQWTRFAGSQPTELFGTSELGVLERPWRGGTTSDLLARMEVHASVAGCAYVTRPRADRLSLLRPDRVIIVMGSETDAEDPSEAPDAEIIGFVHETSRGKMTFFDPDQVAYYAPIPDPDYRFLGMSWITPVIRDLQADSLATEHKARFFCNAATPNIAIKFDASIAIEKVKQFKELLESEHKGAYNAWKTLYLGGGADPVTVGNSFKDMDYAVIEGRAESRLASAAGVPPSWVGFAEGLSGSSLNAGNFNSARRRFSDGTMIHLWGSAATSLEVLLNRPQGATLWYDPRVPFMREDAGDLAAIQQNQAQTIVALVRDGFTPESAVAAVTKNDFSLLVHSGKVSVQLQEPGTNPGFGEQVPKASAPDGARSQERHTPGGKPHNQKSHAGNSLGGVRDALMAARHVGELAQAARKEAKRITGRDISFRFKGTPMTVARDHAEGILTGLEHFPKAPLKEVTTYGPGGAIRAQDTPTVAFAAFAVAMLKSYDEPTDVIMFNTRYNRDERYYRADLKRGKDSAFSTTDDPMGVALHEFGHVVGHYASAEPYLYQHMRRPGVAEKRMSNMAREGVSHYAATDLSELAAEAFADVMANGDEASPLSRELFDVIEGQYRRRSERDSPMRGEVQS